MSARDEDLERGRAVQQAVVGRSAVSGTRAGSSALVPELGELSDEVNWGRIWAREGLDLRSRSLCVIVALMTLGRYPQAFGQIQGARRLGFTREELVEVMVQLTFYVGIHTVHDGLGLVKRAFDEPLPD